MRSFKLPIYGTLSLLEAFQQYPGTCVATLAGGADRIADGFAATIIILSRPFLLAIFFCLNILLVHRDFSDARPPDPLPCQSCLNSRDKSFIGSWVADIVLGNPVGEVLRGFMDQEVPQMRFLIVIVLQDNALYVKTMFCLS